MEQLHAFSKVDRDPVERTISVAYFELINIKKHDKSLINKYSAKWFIVRELSEFIFDHSEMVAKAITQLRYKTSKKSIGFELLPDKFTISQLQKLYESILGEELDKRNFINKTKALDILIKLQKKEMKSSRKGSYLYKFDTKKYNQKVKEGFSFNL